MNESKEYFNREKTENQIQSFAKFPSENPNPVLSIHKSGKILYANPPAQKCMTIDEKNTIEVIKSIKKSVVKALDSELTEMALIECYGRKFSFLVKPILDQDYCNVYGHDITERVIAEEKINVVGRLTRHDALNKFSVIINNVYLAKLHVSDKGKLLKYFDAIELAVDQIKEIFNFASVYEKIGVDKLTLVDVGDCIEVAKKTVGLEKIKLLNECVGITVLADSLLVSVFYNLMHNSILHGKSVKQIRIYSEQNNEVIKLFFEDDGIGIPPNQKALIFKEGYGKKTGYGLYLIQKICETYGWTIKETGKMKNGAKFEIIIPNIIH